MNLVRRRETNHIEIHDDLELLAFMDEDDHHIEIMISPDITIYVSMGVIVVALDDVSKLTLCIEILQAAEFYENMYSKWGM